MNQFEKLKLKLADFRKKDIELSDHYNSILKTFCEDIVKTYVVPRVEYSIHTNENEENKGSYTQQRFIKIQFPKVNKNITVSYNDVNLIIEIKLEDGQVIETSILAKLNDFFGEPSNIEYTTSEL